MLFCKNYRRKCRRLQEKILRKRAETLAEKNSMRRMSGTQESEAREVAAVKDILNEKWEREQFAVFAASITGECVDRT